jgi:hypothetical protein
MSFFARRYMVLGNNRLSGTIPTSFGSFGFLEQLYLDDNDLTGTIPSGIGTMNSLRSVRHRCS